MTYEPDGTLENIGDALGVVSRQLRSTMKDFKKFMEERGRESGALDTAALQRALDAC